MGRSRDDLTASEQQILLAVLRQHPNGYGVSVSREIEERTGKRMAIGVIYAALDRLTERGLLQSREGDPSPERGGRRKLFFQLTASGHETLQRSLEAIEAMRASLTTGGVSWLRG